jgi:hypothetical protein
MSGARSDQKARTVLVASPRGPPHHRGNLFSHIDGNHLPSICLGAQRFVRSPLPPSYVFSSWNDRWDQSVPELAPRLRMTRSHFNAAFDMLTSSIFDGANVKIFTHDSKGQSSGSYIQIQLTQDFIPRKSDPPLSGRSKSARTRGTQQQCGSNRSSTELSSQSTSSYTAAILPSMSDRRDFDNIFIIRR